MVKRQNQGSSLVRKEPGAFGTPTKWSPKFPSLLLAIKTVIRNLLFESKATGIASRGFFSEEIAENAVIVGVIVGDNRAVAFEITTGFDLIG